jgi:hypothetical protein
LIPAAFGSDPEGVSLYGMPERKKEIPPRALGARGVLIPGTGTLVGWWSDHLSTDGTRKKRLKNSPFQGETIWDVVLGVKGIAGP